MSDDRLDEIEKRLNAFKHWKEKQYGNEEWSDYSESHGPDVEWLISEVKRLRSVNSIMREALTKITSCCIVCTTCASCEAKEALEKIKIDG